MNKEITKEQIKEMAKNTAGEASKIIDKMINDLLKMADKHGMDRNTCMETAVDTIRSATLVFDFDYYTVE